MIKNIEIKKYVFLFEYVLDIGFKLIKKFKLNYSFITIFQRPQISFNISI